MIWIPNVNTAITAPSAFQPLLSPRQISLVAGGVHTQAAAGAHEQATDRKGLTGPAFLDPRAEHCACHLRHPHHRLSGQSPWRPSWSRHWGQGRVATITGLIRKDLTDVTVGLCRRYIFKPNQSGILH